MWKCFLPQNTPEEKFKGTISCKIGKTSCPLAIMTVQREYILGNMWFTGFQKTILGIFYSVHISLTIFLDLRRRKGVDVQRTNKMAQLRRNESSKGKNCLPGGDEAHGNWSQISRSRSWSHEDNHGHHRHEKKSVATKMKEKAKKWKSLLKKKKHGHQDDGFNNNSGYPDWGFSLEEDSKSQEEDPEFHGAPMYESEMAPEVYRDAETRNLSPGKVIAEGKHFDPIETSELQPSKADALLSEEEAEAVEDKEKINSGDPSNENNNTISNTALTVTVSNMLTPAYSLLIEATNMIASKLQAPIMSARDEAVSKQMCDTRLTVKEYILQKLEPGEDERALSEIITEAITPTSKSEETRSDIGVMEKVRDVVSSVVFGETQAPDVPEIPISTMPYTTISDPEDTDLLSSQQVPMLSSKSLPHETSRSFKQTVPACSRSMSLSAAASSSRPYCRSVTWNPTIFANYSSTGEIEEIGTKKTLQEYLKGESSAI